MSVRPVAFNADGSVDVVFDEQGHTGTVPPADIQWGVDHRAILLACPDNCGAVSTHPVGGGAAPFEVQHLFINKIARDGCPCGQVGAVDRTALPEAHAQLLCNRMDGPGRWRHSGPVALAAYAVGTFSVVYRYTDRLIIGADPEGSVSTDNGVQNLPLEEYEPLMRFDPAYLSADNQHVQGTPVEAAA